jgi:hypothetical protein
MISSISGALWFWTYASWFATLIVFAGVAGEVVTEFTDWITADDRKRRLNRLAAFVLVAGLAGELLTLVMTSVLAEAEIAKLNKAAASARLEAARIEKEYAARSLTKEQERAMSAALVSFAGQSINVLAYRNNVEAWVLADEIEKALGKFGDGARWKVQFGTVMEYNRATSGILIEIADSASPRAHEAARALASAIQTAQLAFGGPLSSEPRGLRIDAFGDNLDSSPNAIHLTVGINLGGPLAPIP